MPKPHRRYQKGRLSALCQPGIGTTGFPIRLGARPEITVFEMTRGVERHVFGNDLRFCACLVTPWVGYRNIVTGANTPRTAKMTDDEQY
jgi:hypothetical protein